MSPEEIKLECLKIAADKESDIGHVEDTARRWASFVAGDQDSKVIEAARRFVSEVTPDACRERP